MKRTILTMAFFCAILAAKGQKLSNNAVMPIDLRNYTYKSQCREAALWKLAGAAIIICAINENSHNNRAALIVGGGIFAANGVSMKLKAVKEFLQQKRTIK